MVAGLDIFKQYFEDDTDKYVLIGGAACDTVFTSNDAVFRVTKDLDMVLIVEALTPEFGEKLWKFVDVGGYKNRNTSSGKPQFFRFTEPNNPEFPKMIELFARTEFELREPDVLTPIHIDDDIASLSGILLDEDYYSLLLRGRTVIDGLSVLRPEYLILFKAKAYMDLKAKREQGDTTIHSSEYKKHKRDVLRIAVEMAMERTDDLPASVLQDIANFIAGLEQDPFDVNTLHNYGVTTEEVSDRLTEIFRERGSIL